MGRNGQAVIIRNFLGLPSPTWRPARAACWQPSPNFSNYRNHVNYVGPLSAPDRRETCGFIRVSFAEKIHRRVSRADQKARAPGIGFGTPTSCGTTSPVGQGQRRCQSPQVSSRANRHTYWPQSRQGWWLPSYRRRWKWRWGWVVHPMFNEAWAGKCSDAHRWRPRSQSECWCLSYLAFAANPTGAPPRHPSPVNHQAIPYRKRWTRRWTAPPRVRFGQPERWGRTTLTVLLARNAATSAARWTAKSSGAWILVGQSAGQNWPYASMNGK